MSRMICTPHPIFWGAIKSRRMRWARHVAGIEVRRTQGFGEETRGKETTWKTQA
jgi:hypothetical protein